MRLELERVQLGPDACIGNLVVDGTWTCWTCEDPVREVRGKPVALWKIPGATAIPFGTYQVDITHSQRFQRDLPVLQDVAGFTGVRIHTGNGVADTEGCILPGLDRHANSVARSRAAFDPLFAQLRAAKAGGQAISIRIWTALPW